MMDGINRRSFLENGALAAAGAAMMAQTQSAFAAAGGAKRNIKKSLKIGMVGAGGNFEEKLQICKAAGFDSVEADTLFDQKDVEALKKASDKLTFPIDAVVCSTHWGSPLSHPDPEVAKQTVEGMKVSIRNIKDLGGDMVLLVPAVVSEEINYDVAYERSLKWIKEEIAPFAEDMEITIGLENVWNKFLLSPLEFRRYIDDIGSPRVRAWFDVGNVVAFGYPAGWVQVLSDYIVRVDVKDFKGAPMTGGTFVPLLEGSVPWPQVMKAFDEIGFQGVFAAEVQGGDQAYLTEMVSKRMDEIIAL